MQTPEYVAQGVITVLLLLTGKWVTGLLSLVLTAYHVRAYLRQEHQVGLSVQMGLCPQLTMAHACRICVKMTSCSQAGSEDWQCLWLGLRQSSNVTLHKDFWPKLNVSYAQGV